MGYNSPGVSGAACAEGCRGKPEKPFLPSAARRTAGRSYNPGKEKWSGGERVADVAAVPLEVPDNTTGSEGRATAEIGVSVERTGRALSERLPSVNRVQEFQRKLYRKAKAEPKLRFYTLYDKTYRMDFLHEAYRRVRANNGAPGIDGETFEQVEAYGIGRYLQELSQELQEKRYEPKPVKRVYIPKPNGDLRPLGIPTIRDRIVQASFKLVIEPIFEAGFSDRSFGFRPKRSAHQAIREVAKLLNWGCTDIYDVDLSKYFDTVNHRKLMKLIAQRIMDRMILHVIKQWLSCGYMEDGQHRAPKQGTPQGGVISPLLANIYLNPMDWAMEKSKLWWRDRGSVHLVRYADDFVLMARRGLEAGKAIIHHFLRRLGLTINGKKTKQYTMAESGSMEYLGFKFTRTVNRKKGGKFFLLTPGPKAMNWIRERIRQCVRYSNPVTIGEMVQDANAIIRGWVNYFQLGNPSQCFGKIRDFVNKRVRRVLQRRKGRPGFGYERYDSDFIYGKLGLLYSYRALPL
jgi:group II intron reverse transcriptase/maturase